MTVPTKEIIVVGTDIIELRLGLSKGQFAGADKGPGGYEAIPAAYGSTKDVRQDNSQHDDALFVTHLSEEVIAKDVVEWL